MLASVALAVLLSLLSAESHQVEGIKCAEGGFSKRESGVCDGVCLQIRKQYGSYTLKCTKSSEPEGSICNTGDFCNVQPLTPGQNQLVSNSDLKVKCLTGFFTELGDSVCQAGLCHQYQSRQDANSYYVGCGVCPPWSRNCFTCNTGDNCHVLKVLKRNIMVRTTEAPTTEAPTTEAPTTEAPTTEAPTTEAPTTEAATTEALTTEALTTEAPTTEAPSTEAPTTEAATTEAPTTEAATTEAPTDISRQSTPTKSGANNSASEVTASAAAAVDSSSGGLKATTIFVVTAATATALAAVAAIALLVLTVINWRSRSHA